MIAETVAISEPVIIRFTKKWWFVLLLCHGGATTDLKCGHGERGNCVTNCCILHIQYQVSWATVHNAAVYTMFSNEHRRKAVAYNC